MHGSKSLFVLLLLCTSGASGCARGDAAPDPRAPAPASSESSSAAPTNDTPPAKASEDRPLTIEQICETRPCRKNVTVDLQKTDGSRFTKTYSLMPPAVQNSLITVIAGETVLVEATPSAARPTDFVQVAQVAHPERTLSFKLEQHEKDGKVFMMLTSHNPFARDIRFHLGMNILSGNGVVKTSSCPVRAGLQTVEIWPDPIFQILVDDIRFMEAGESRACVE